MFEWLVSWGARAAVRATSTAIAPRVNSTVRDRPQTKSPAVRPGFRDSCAGVPLYCEIRRLERFVPICWNVVTIWLADVSRKNLLESGYLPGLPAQFFSSVDVASPPVLTWMV